MLAALVAAAALLPGFSVVDAPPGGGMLLSGVVPDQNAPSAARGYVYLPPGFNPAQRYPVVYLLHGLRGDASEYAASLQLRSYADTQISTGALRPFIAVVPGGPPHDYDGEWAGIWERYVVATVHWIDARLPTIRSGDGRVLAGLSAGGFGAYDIGLRHPNLFGRLEAWSGYFVPLNDQPFKDASNTTLEANDPRLLVPREAARLRRIGVRFFVSCGPKHGRWDSPQETLAFAQLARRSGIPTAYRFFPSKGGHWRAEFDAGLQWAFGTSR